MTAKELLSAAKADEDESVWSVDWQGIFGRFMLCVLSIPFLSPGAIPNVARALDFQDS